MLYRLRRDGRHRRSGEQRHGRSPRTASSRPARPRRLLRIESAGEWRSPRSGASYPARWRLRVPGEGLDLDVRPLLADQELDVSFRYWEGAVEIAGTRRGRPVQGRGYVELTGYAEPPLGKNPARRARWRVCAAQPSRPHAVPGPGPAAWSGECLLILFPPDGPRHGFSPLVR